MDIQILNINQDLPKEVESATKLLVDSFLSKLYPFLQNLGSKIANYLRNDELRENVTNVHNVFALCVSQINKCYVSFIDILKLENHEELLLLESRRCTLERLSWCCSRLVAIEDMLEGITNNDRHDSAFDESIFDPPLYFVNWIDQTFDDLKTLTNLILLSDPDSKHYDQWKSDMVGCLKSLHNSIDELLLSAMTLCRYCLSADQHAIKARCQVVLRETKTLLCDIIEGDIDTAFNNSEISLNLPIKQSNVNVLIDVLKDVLYALETNTSRGVLALLVHCFGYSISPVDVLKNHYKDNKGICDCLSESGETKTCDFVKEFDLHNERLLQIGSFAMSCSADEKRILSIRSNLASLEALDPHLVPALIMAPDSHHSILLSNTWNKEVLEIKNSIFLIVDPAAFSEKARQVMQQKLLEIIKDNVYDNNKICSVINIGCIVYDFFDVYEKNEPEAIQEREQLIPLLSDLNKVQLECKVVSDLLSSGSDFLYKVKKSSKTVTFHQILKRLKLLYTIVNKINKLLRPDDDNDLFDESAEENGTYTVYKVNNETRVNTPKQNILSRSVFARTKIRSPAKYPLYKLTKHLKQNLKSNFSARLDELCNSDEVSKRNSVSCFYSPARKRSSLRKAVLNKNPVTLEQDIQDVCGEISRVDVDLQISEVLNQINNLTSTFSSRPFKTEFSKVPKLLNIPKGEYQKVPTLDNFVDKSGIEPDVNISTLSVSQPSNITTLERLNDLDLVESKLTDLRVLQLETNL